MADGITPGCGRYQALEMRAEMGDADAAFDLGLLWSCGSHGFTVDLIQAHKWFNLAALGGNDAAADWRHEIAEEMTAREIIEAQRQARIVLNLMLPKAA